MQQPLVTILMTTYNGELYLNKQLQSFSTQTYTNWCLCVSDDGSTDDTLNLLQNYQQNLPANKVRLYSGPKRGFAANFLSLVCNSDIQSDYYAYSDQDDIWNADKLQIAIDWLQTVPKDVPALYCGRTQLIDAEEKHIGYSIHYKNHISFKNALVQNISGGNTMVFNQAACDLLCKAGFSMPIVAHDWWTYMLVTGCGGKVYFDATPHLLYRQHGGAQIGANTGWYARLARISLLFAGRFKQWNKQNCAALLQVKSILTAENQRVLEEFVIAREQSFWQRLISMKQTGVYRQTYLGNMGLIAATFLGKI
jgi:glycosyltransferase involved in cell wall biosynthesis